MSFNKELKDQRRLEKDKKNLEKVHQLLSDRQQRANETNALKSTGPRTEEGKQRIRSQRPPSRPDRPGHHHDRR